MKKMEFLVLLFFSSCTAHPPLLSVRWSGQGPAPSIDKYIEKSEIKNQQKSLDEEVQIFQQKASGFQIEGSFIKIVKQKNDTPVFQSALIVQNISTLNLLKAFRLDQKKENIWQQFIKSHPSFSNEKKVLPLEVIFLTSPTVHPAVVAVLEEKSGFLHALKISENADLIIDQALGSRLTDLVESMSTAFPRGPKKSALSPVLINRRNQSEGLSDGIFEVLSVSPSKIILAEPLEYPTSDDRFDQIQAFYYSQQIMSWFNEKLGQNYSAKVRIVTQLGFPEKTNAAFYFQNQIRLGQGDNETYAHIAWDPTIVMHETSHAVIDALSRLPFQGEGGSINEGYADIFTTFFLESPLLGENSYLLGPYKRTVDQNLKLSEKNGGLYHDSAIVSGFFWNLKKQIDADKTLQLAVRVLNRLGPNSNFEDFKMALNEQVTEVLNEEQIKKAHQLMKERDLL